MNPTRTPGDPSPARRCPQCDFALVIEPEQQLLVRAAEILEEEAECLAARHIVDGVWTDSDREEQIAHASHDEMVDVASRLRKAGEYQYEHEEED